MGFIELFFVAVGLSADAFAVSLCRGLKSPVLDRKHALIVGLFFGGFQALMPAIGWLLGIQFEHLISEYDHWIVLALLLFIGGKMIVEALRGNGGEEACAAELDMKELLLLAVATSIDALAVGISFAFLTVPILPAALLIGATTFSLSVLGVCIGHRFGVRYKKRAEIAGGLILCLLGVKILLEHLGILG